MLIGHGSEENAAGAHRREVGGEHTAVEVGAEEEIGPVNCGTSS